MYIVHGENPANRNDSLLCAVSFFRVQLRTYWGLSGVLNPYFKKAFSLESPLSYIYVFAVRRTKNIFLYFINWFITFYPRKSICM